MPHPPGCPACGSAAPLGFVEDHFDRVGGKRYRLLRCPDCGVVSSEPREPVGADWYAKAAPIRGRERHAPPQSDWRFRQFFADGVAPGRLLDVGCGDGGFMRLALERGFEPTGFDYDERVAAQARAKGLDAQAMEFSDFISRRKPGEFDTAVLFDVLEHTPEPAWFFGQIKRLLHPGAHVAITLPNDLRPLPWGRVELDYPPHHFTRWTPDSMRSFLERQGFDVVRQESSALKLRYLSDHLFFYRVMPGVLALAKRLLFGKTAREDGATLTELYGRADAAKPGFLSDKLRRQRIVDAARFAFQCLFAPAGLILRAYYRRRDPRGGDYLYTLARYRG